MRRVADETVNAMTGVNRTIKLPFVLARDVTLHAPRRILSGISVKTKAALFRIGPRIGRAGFVKIGVRLPRTMTSFATHNFRPPPRFQSGMNCLLELAEFRIVAYRTVIAADIRAAACRCSQRGHGRRIDRGRPGLGDGAVAPCGSHHDATKPGALQPHSDGRCILRVPGSFISFPASTPYTPGDVLCRRTRLLYRSSACSYRSRVRSLDSPAVATRNSCSAFTSSSLRRFTSRSYSRSSAIDASQPTR